MIQRLGWVTAREARGHDEDEELGLEALRDTGVSVEVVDWDDAQVDWSAFDRVVLRSTWDYVQRLPDFLAWLERVDAVTEVVNFVELVRWSLNKLYLAELDEAGVAIIPTSFVAPGDEPQFPSGSFVVKPAVGAGSRDVSSYGPDQRAAARDHVDQIHTSGQTALVQPFLHSVAADGEWPLIFFDGRFSHAASKRVTIPQAGRIDELYAAEANTEHVATADQIAVAQAAVDFVSARLSTPTYARIDVVRDDEGRFCVLEVELVEPSLFLPYGGQAAVERFVRALTQ